MTGQSTSTKQRSRKDTGLTLHLMISESCVKLIAYFVLALSVGSSFVITQQAPMLSPQASDTASPQR
jgi:hypothetical protein